MSTDEQWRTQIAQRLATTYAANPNVAAVFLGGSAARGQADRYSDLEVGVLWHTDPTESERAAAITQAGGEIHLLYAPEGIFWDDTLFVGHDESGRAKSGQTVEVCHLRNDVVSQIVDQLGTEPDTDDLVMNLLSGIADGIPLHGAKVLTGYGDAVRAYPDALVRAVVRRHGQIEFFWRWEMLVHRGNHPGPIQAQLWSVQQHVLQMLLAVNRRYPVGYKFLDAIFDRCALAPAHLADRFDAVSTRPPAHAAAELRSLVLEAYDLVDELVPGLDPGEVDRWRHYFGYQRPFWGSAPPHP